jgi:hypothetical protein
LCDPREKGKELLICAEGECIRKRKRKKKREKNKGGSGILK